jgi:uncharacterized protein YlzI (FlbEa/FlbD family)
MVTVQRLYRRHAVDWVTASPLWQPYYDQNQQPSEQPNPLNLAIDFREPAILRFTSDTFMEDFLKVATTAPERLKYWRVQKETWRIPAPTPSVNLPSDDVGESDLALEEKMSGNDLTIGQSDELEAQKFIKLYQPANQRFYLVTANLVCRIPGLPDKMLNLSNGEKVSFVLRRFIGGKEYALINETWRLITDYEEEQLIEKLQQELKPGEQQFPMFPVTYYAEADGHKRRMFAGLVPVSGREKFINAEINSKALPDLETNGSSSSNADPLVSQVDQLMTVIDMDVLQPWETLVQEIKRNSGKKLAVKCFIDESIEKIGRVYTENNEDTESNNNDVTEKETQLELLKASAIKQRDQLRVASHYILLDLAEFIKIYLSSLWEVIINAEDEVRFENKPNTKELLNKFKEARFQSGDDGFINSEEPNDYYALIEGESSPDVGKTLPEFLKELENYRDFLEDAKLAYDTTNPDSILGWPPEFLLSGTNVRNILSDLKDTREDPLFLGKISKKGLFRLALEEEFRSESSTKRIPLTPLSQKISQSDIERAANNPDEDNDIFLIRCVFERPHCPPPLRQVVSQPTLKFQMASYFDPDAPARPIRIPMPVDTTPAGLRKFTKNTMFAISDSLACQIELARKLTFGDLVLSVLPWPFHKDLPEPREGNCKTQGVDIGKLCTLSIPIITICALILLIIIVLLLDQIFKWVPYLIYCLPLPGLKAKKGGNP